MELRTVVMAQDPGNGYTAHLYRQFPGVWPLGSSVVGNTLFLPMTGRECKADWLICWTPPPAEIITSIPKERRIFFIAEPPEFWSPSAEFLEFFGWVVTPYALEGFGHNQILGVTTGVHWWYGVEMSGHQQCGNYLNLAQIIASPRRKKIKKVSTIVSGKNFLPGHQARLNFTSLLKNVLGDSLDVFGYPHNPIADKRSALDPYQYHLAIENALYPHYWTEKLSDSILGRCVTFYHGASEIGQYFSGKSVIPIDIRSPEKAIKIIQRSLETYEIDSKAIENDRIRLIENFNFPSYVDKIISGIERNLSKVSESTLRDKEAA